MCYTVETERIDIIKLNYSTIDFQIGLATLVEISRYRYFSIAIFVARFVVRKYGKIGKEKIHRVSRAMAISNDVTRKSVVLSTQNKR